jgi:hypothetical protein
LKSTSKLRASLRDEETVPFTQQLASRGDEKIFRSYFAQQLASRGDEKIFRSYFAQRLASRGDEKTVPFARRLWE